MSVVITSYNRHDLLIAGLVELDRQTLPLQVVVVDDGSTDGSPEAVSELFPTVTVLANRTGVSNGVTRQLARAYECCSCPITASFDEDFHLNRPDALELLRGYFDDPRVAIVTVPFRDVLINDVLQQSAPEPDGLWQRYTFVGNGYLVDMEKYRAVGGYRPWNDSYRQEEDLALRLLDAGWIVRLAPPRVEGLHWRQPGGLGRTTRFRSARNDMLFYWMYTPLPLLALFLALTAARNIADGWCEGDIATRARGIAAAPRHGFRHSLNRRPVSMSTFRWYRFLKRNGPVLLNEKSVIHE